MPPSTRVTSSAEDEALMPLPLANPPVDGSMTPVCVLFGDSTIPTSSWLSTSSTFPPSSARSMDRAADEMYALSCLDAARARSAVRTRAALPPTRLLTASTRDWRSARVSCPPAMDCPRRTSRPMSRMCTEAAAPAMAPRPADRMTPPLRAFDAMAPAHAPMLRPVSTKTPVSVPVSESHGVIGVCGQY